MKTQNQHSVKPETQSCQMAVSGSVALISMVDFVIKESTNKEVSKNFSGFSDIVNNKRLSYDNILKYANFLKQPLEIWMFIPCDSNGNIVKKPDLSDANGRQYDENIDEDMAWAKYNTLMKQGNKKVLFNGFKFQDANEDYPMPFVYLNEDVTLYPETFDEYSKVEDLVYYSDFITLSDKSKDILGLTDSCLTDR